MCLVGGDASHHRGSRFLLRLTPSLNVHLASESSPYTLSLAQAGTLSPSNFFVTWLRPDRSLGTSTPRNCIITVMDIHYGFPTTILLPALLTSATWVGSRRVVSCSSSTQGRIRTSNRSLTVFQTILPRSIHPISISLALWREPGDLRCMVGTSTALR